MQNAEDIELQLAIEESIRQQKVDEKSLEEMKNLEDLVQPQEILQIKQ